MPVPMSEAVNAWNSDPDAKDLGEAFPKQVADDSLGEETPSSETHSEEPETSDEAEVAESSEAKAEEEAKELEKVEEEPKVPLSRFQKVYEERNALKARVAVAESRPATSLTDDEKWQLDEDKKLEQKLDAYLSRKEQVQRTQDDAQAEELVELQEVYGAYDVDKVLSIKDEYHIKDNTAAVKLYFKMYGTGAKPKSDAPTVKTEKPKVPQPKSSGSASGKAVPNIAEKSLNQLVEEGLQEHGIKR